MTGVTIAFSRSASPRSSSTMVRGVSSPRRRSCPSLRETGGRCVLRQPLGKCAFDGCDLHPQDAPGQFEKYGLRRHVPAGKACHRISWPGRFSQPPASAAQPPPLSPWRRPSWVRLHGDGRGTLRSAAPVRADSVRRCTSSSSPGASRRSLRRGPGAPAGWPAYPPPCRGFERTRASLKMSAASP